MYKARYLQIKNPPGGLTGGSVAFMLAAGKAEKREERPLLT